MFLSTLLGAFPSFDNLVSPERLVVEPKGPNFLRWGLLLSVYEVLLTVKISKSG